MKNSHLTMRMPAPLARLLARWASDHRVPKSQVVRDAVAHYLAGTAGEPAVPALAARDFARRWAALPRLLPEEADGLASDIAASRGALAPPEAPWE